jgi:hypothetical protein
MEYAEVLPVLLPSMRVLRDASLFVDCFTAVCSLLSEQLQSFWADLSSSLLVASKLGAAWAMTTGALVKTDLDIDSSCRP